MDYLGILIAAVAILVSISRIWEACRAVLWRPYALAESFRKQGIRGPPYSVLVGSLLEMKRLKMEASEMVLDTNSNDLTQRVLPHYHKWCPLYGEPVVFWYGTSPRIAITDPELVKQVLSSKFGFYDKIKPRPLVRALTGKGLVIVSNGPEWVRHRRIINPAFSVDKLKKMVKQMAACTMAMLDEWNQSINPKDQCAKLDMSREFQKLSADIIAHTAFGSSYGQGGEAFKAQDELGKIAATASISVFIPGSQYLPTPSNIQAWKLERKVKSTIKRIIASRMKSQCTNGDDLLGLIMGASENVEGNAIPKLNMDEIMEECKSFFFAGHETTASLLTWTVFLLSLHQDWQARLREEVLTECRMAIPDADMLSKLKLLNMVLQEVLRLYCPAIELNRQVSEDIKLGNLMIPKNTYVAIPILKIHRSKEYWGEDANEFKPLRFANGISKAAKHPNAFLGFGMGPRNCIGQNFAMLEVKTAIVLILQRFSFSLSSEYKHAPINNLTLQPQFGLPVIVKPLRA